MYKYSTFIQSSESAKNNTQSSLYANCLVYSLAKPFILHSFTHKKHEIYCRCQDITGHFNLFNFLYKGWTTMEFFCYLFIYSAITGKKQGTKKEGKEKNKGIL